MKAHLEILMSHKSDTTLNDIKVMIEGDRQQRGSSFNISYAWSSLMQLADEKNHFASQIIENALNGKFVSEKQAWVVAFFAKNNGLVN